MSSIFDKLADLQKNQVPASIARGKAAIDSDPASAVQLLQFATANDPNNAEAWSLLGRALSNSDRSSEAETAYRRLLSLQPDSPEPFLGIGIELLTQERPGEAEPFLMHGLLLSQEQSAVDLYNLALCLYQQNREGEAIPFARSSYDKESDPATAVLLADACYATGNGDDAARFYDAALQSDQDDLHSAERLGPSLELAGRTQEAIDAINQAIAKGSQMADLYGSLSRCYQALGQTEDAQAAAAKYFDLTGGGEGGANTQAGADADESSEEATNP